MAALFLFPALAAAQQSTEPGAPTDFSATKGTTHRQVFLAWRPPEATGGSPITQYVINYAENANFPQNATTAVTLDVEGTPDRLTKKIASLDRGTRYYFRVAAVNANGQGAWSDTENATPSPVITVAAVNNTITEGADAVFRVRLWPAPKSNTTVTVAISAEGSYGDIATSKNVTVRRNENSREFTIGTTDDASHEPDGLITVRVSRHGGYAVGNQRTAKVSITNDDENQAPTVTGDGDTAYAENGTHDVATYTVTDPDAGSIHDWTLDGADEASFTIIDGTLRFMAPPNYETQATYAVTVIATDNGEPALSDTIPVTVTATSGAGTREMTATQNLTVTVTNVNEPPSVSGNATVTYAENGTDVVATYTVTDPDAGSSHTWTLDGAGDTAFTINNGVLSFNAPPNYETKSFYSVTVIATDNGTPAMSGTKTVTVAITDVNEVPEVNGDGDIIYAENGTHAVATYTVTDPDADSTHEWTLDGDDEASFTLSGGVLSFNTPPDYETQYTYAVTVIATDNGTPAMSGTKTVTVTITDVNEVPEVNGDGDIIYAENGTHAVATYTVTDPDADSTHDWTLDGADEASFTLSDGVLSFIAPPDYETKSDYSVTVTATDNGTPAMSGSKSVTVTITDLNEKPKVKGKGTVNYDENGSADVATYTVTDPDADSSHGWSVKGPDAAAFAISEGVLSFISPPDYETKSTYSVKVKATDNGTPAKSDTKSVTVTITDLNEEPEVNGDGDISYAENGEDAVATYTVTDPDADSTHEWTLDGADNAAFTITNGVLSFITPPDFETKSAYSVTIVATDDGTPALSDTIAVTVTITDVNENVAPTVSGDAAVPYAEKSDSAVHTYSVSDDDAEDTHEWTLEGADNAAFTITNGVLSFKTPPDFETKSTYSVTVKATDNGTPALSDTIDVTVTITNVNEEPQVNGDATVNFAENGTNAVATYTVTDPDAGSSQTWSVAGTDHAAFSITNGVLSFTTPPNFETKSLYEVTVKATDNGSPEMSGTKTVNVTITDLNEEPQFTSSNSFSLAENGTAVGNVSASDEDSADSVTYALSGTDANLFTIANNGALSFKAAPNFEAPQGGAKDDSNSYELTVTATSGTGTRAMTATQNLTVTVTNVNEPPTVDGETSIDYTENGEDAVETYTVTDPDAGSEHDWTVEGNDAAAFTIDNGVLSFTTPPDYETQTSYSVTVKATDDGSPALSDSITVTVAITDVPTSYRQIRIWTGRNLDNDDVVLLVTVGAWSTNPNPNDAADITSETTTETRDEDEKVRKTIKWTDNHGNYAYQRSQWNTPLSQDTQYREKRDFSDGCGTSYGSWSTNNPPPSAPDAHNDGSGFEFRNGGTQVRRYLQTRNDYDGTTCTTYSEWLNDADVARDKWGTRQMSVPDVTYTTSIQNRPVTVGEAPVYTPISGPTEERLSPERRERQ